MMYDPNYYQTIEASSEAEYNDRGSRFIALSFSVLSIDEFKQKLAEVKTQHPKASHHCFAYRIGADGMTFRASDAGEPSGTAGRPILGQIDSKGLTNVCVIVARYFGGTLLGVPGLINAYKTAASLALQLTPTVRKSVEVIYQIQFDYTIVNDVLTSIKRFNCSVLKQDLQLFSIYEIGVPKINEMDLVRMLSDIKGCSVKKKSDQA